MKKVVFLDVYGTLISTGDRSVRAAEAILKRNHSDLDPAAFYGEWKGLHREICREERFVREEEAFRLGLETLYRRYGLPGNPRRDVALMTDTLYRRKAFPDTLPALAQLEKRCWLAIASNTDNRPLLENLRENHLTLSQIFTSQSLECYKPNPAFYREILKRMDCPPREAVFVGDSGEEDVKGPKAAGMAAILLDRKGNGRDFGQDGTISSLLQLPQVIESL